MAVQPLLAVRAASGGVLVVAFSLAALVWVVGAVALHFGVAVLLARSGRAAAATDRAAAFPGPQTE